MTNNSNTAYNSTAELRATNAKKVFEALQTEPNQSRFEIGRKSGLGDIESQRRLSDLVNDGKVIITGSRKHFKCDISLYSVLLQTELFPVKKVRLRAWLKKEFPEVLAKYELLINHNL